MAASPIKRTGLINAQIPLHSIEVARAELTHTDTHAHAAKHQVESFSRRREGVEITSPNCCLDRRTAQERYWSQGVGGIYDTLSHISFLVAAMTTLEAAGAVAAAVAAVPAAAATISRQAD